MNGPHQILSMLMMLTFRVKTQRKLSTRLCFHTIIQDKIVTYWLLINPLKMWQS